MSTLATTNIKHPSSASNNIVLDSSGGVDLDALTVSGSAPADSVNIDASGRLLVGTSTSTSEDTVVLQGTSTSSSVGGILRFRRNNSVVAGDRLGRIVFDNGSSNPGAFIDGQGDGTFASGSFPSRLVFSVTADGASSPTERMRITSSGYARFSTSGNYRGTNAGVEINQSTNNYGVWTENSFATFQSDSAIFNVHKSANSDYQFLRCFSNNLSDSEFNLRGDGQAYADQSWNGGGADYAEYFEWSDNNPETEDRRGISVVLDGDKIRKANVGEDPIGVISGNPSVVGDSAWNKWSGKYLRDEFGTYIQENYEVEDEDGNTVVQKRRKLNPAHNPDVEYISREQRPEWDCVGLMGKLRIRKGQVTGSRWIKMRDISDTVEEWLVR